MSASNPQKKKILHIGLDGPHDSTAAATSMTRDWIHSQLESAVSRAEATGHYSIQLTFTMPDTFAATLTDLRKELSGGGWDALVIGGGLKMTPALTREFEAVVNACREASPRTRILFQAAPGDLDEAIKRGFEGEV